MAKTKHDMQTVLDAIRGEGAFEVNGRKASSGGNVRLVANRLGIARITVYSYRNRWKTVDDAFIEEKQEMLDMAENKLWQLINEGNITAIIFYLKTQGKERGYVERQELSGTDKPVAIRIYEVDNAPDDG